MHAASEAHKRAFVLLTEAHKRAFVLLSSMQHMVYGTACKCSSNWQVASVQLDHCRQHGAFKCHLKTLQYARRLTGVGVVGHSTNRLRRHSHDDFEASLTQQMKVLISDETSLIYTVKCFVGHSDVSSGFWSRCTSVGCQAV